MLKEIIENEKFNPLPKYQGNYRKQKSLILSFGVQGTWSAQVEKVKGSPAR